MILNQLKNKNILITGSTSGIGHEIACQFDQQGANLVLVGRTKEKLEKMEKEFNGNTAAVLYDLSDLENIEEIFRQCKAKIGKLDGMVHCAGSIEMNLIRANDIKAMKRQMDVNAFSFFELGKYFSMKKYSNNNSSIVAISSVAVFLNDPGMVQYSASKAALNAAVKTMAKEFIKRKIRVNAILPANVNTEMFTSGIGAIENFLEDALKRQPLGIIEPEQIAYLTEFLLSDNAKYITGELAVVGGGMEY